MASELSHQYCNRADMEAVFSAAGVRLRLDDDLDGGESSDEDNVLDWFIDNATLTVDTYCWSKYAPANLAASIWVQRRAAVLACYDLARRRGNPSPESMEEWADDVMEELKAVANNGMPIPHTPQRRDQAPRMDNVRADPRYLRRVIRVERSTSSQQTTSRPQNIDYQDAFTYEI